MDAVAELTKLYIVILLFAFLVERFMEILMEIWNYIEWKANLYAFWNRQAEKVQKRFERTARGQLLSHITNLVSLTRQIRYATRYKKKGHSEHVVIVSAEVLRQSIIAIFSRVIATTLGIVFCLKAEINLVAIFENEVGKLIDMPTNVQILLSGVIIGLGSEPVHNIIRAMEKRRAERTRARISEKAASEQL